MNLEKLTNLKKARTPSSSQEDDVFRTHAYRLCPACSESAANGHLKPILTLKKVPNPKVHNPYGFERIEILHFNFDGKGGALIRFDDEKDLQCLYGEDLQMILQGEPYSGQRWYRPE